MSQSAKDSKAERVVERGFDLGIPRSSEVNRVGVLVPQTLHMIIYQIIPKADGFLSTHTLKLGKRV